MPETVYLTQWIRDMLTSMVFDSREQMNLLLGDRVSHNDIYVTNATVPFKGETTSVSIGRIPGFDKILGAVLNANRIYRGMGLTWDRFVLFWCHSHPRLVGEIVPRGYEAWSVYEVPPQYDTERGNVIGVKDRDGNLLYFSLMDKNSQRGGDDLFIQQTADTWRTMEYTFFTRPSFRLIGKPMTGDGVEIDCFKYDPEMRLGKIRKIPIAEQVLTKEQLMKTILDPEKSLYNVEEQSGRVVLPYRRR